MAASWLIRLCFLTVNVLIQSLLVKSNSDFCASVFESQTDHVLVGHVMNTSTVADDFECHQKCLGNNSCKSFNVHPGADFSKRVCELNNKTRKTTPDNFKEKKGSSYYGHVKVTCQDLPTNKKKQTGHRHPDFTKKPCEIPRRGWNSKQPAYSCKSIRDSGDSKGDGKYWIDPENSGIPLKVYCDMTTDGGGWVLISNVTMQSSKFPSQLPVKTSYRGITSEQMVIKKSAMNELKTHLSFTQLRFHCSKKNGRTFHVTTAPNSTGEAVVQYFSGQTDVMPASCGSFIKMKNDNSVLATVCKRWGRENGVYGVGKWSHQERYFNRLYVLPAFDNAGYLWVLSPKEKRWECDDYFGKVTAGDFWKIYVR